MGDTGADSSNHMSSQARPNKARHHHRNNFDCFEPHAATLIKWRRNPRLTRRVHKALKRSPCENNKRIMDSPVKANSPACSMGASLAIQKAHSLLGEVLDVQTTYCD